MNIDNTETFTIRAMKEPCIVNDTDTDTLDWIHGDSRERNSNPVQLSDSDVWYLLEHLFLNLMNLMLGRHTLGGAWPDVDGEVALRHWRLINLLCIKSGIMTRDDVKEKFLEICEVHDVEDDSNILALFDIYVL